MGLRISSYHIGAHTPSLPRVQTDSGLDAAEITPPSATTGNREVTISTLAQRLSEATLRADSRDASLDRQALARKARALANQIMGTPWRSNRPEHDAEAPKSDAPQSAASAKQATAFAHGLAENPFKGMTRHQLLIIAYDEGGAFTVNERHAAWQEAFDQEETWRRQAIARSGPEYATTGKHTRFFVECIEHYQGLPAIEQAQYPVTYVSSLRHAIATERPTQPQGSQFVTLLELLLRHGLARNRRLAALAMRATPSTASS
ncbi:hypothetical protein D7S89_22580 [Trinickia fusca]|uniref:Uncharacterized protein n=1 Tax=Trinickia fusca TaxID=2419777 RepID=A0A494X0P6_9BURK|nr:hypothetical protein D7S89_22580 [Trinickia fusca]